MSLLRGGSKISVSDPSVTLSWSRIRACRRQVRREGTAEVPHDRFPPMAYWARATLTVAGVVAVLFAAWTVRSILLLVLVSAVLAVGLDPQVRWLQRHRVSRAWAVTIIGLLSLAFLAIFAWLVIPQAVREAHDLAREFPGYLDRLRTSTGALGSLEDRFHLSTRLQQAASHLPDLAVGKVPSFLTGAGSVIANTLTVAVLTIYFLLGLERGRATASSMAAGEHADRNLRILGVPFAAGLAVWVAIADLIPGVGAMIGAVVCVIVALFTSVVDGIVVAVYFIVYQRFENYLILPRVMTKAIDLSAPTVIVTLLIGSSLAGLAGALIALPIVAALKVVIREVWLDGGTQSGTR